MASSTSFFLIDRVHIELGNCKLRHLKFADLRHVYVGVFVARLGEAPRSTSQQEKKASQKSGKIAILLHEKRKYRSQRWENSLVKADECGLV